MWPRTKEIAIYVVWLVLVVAWNYGYPHAPPIADVLVSVVLAVFTITTARKIGTHLE